MPGKTTMVISMKKLLTAAALAVLLLSQGCAFVPALFVPAAQATSAR
jgi:hypothetical protein